MAEAALAPISRAAFAIGAPLLVALACASAWQAAKMAGWLPITIPAPTDIEQAFERSWSDLLYHVTPTLLSALAGFAIAALLAALLGGIAISFAGAEPVVLKLGIVIDSIPLIALTPILMLWVGNGVASRIIIATIAALFPLLVGFVQGFKAIDRHAAELFHILAASRWQTWRKLALPSALPYIFAALKIAAPLAVLGALIAEWISADRGIGIMMIMALFSFDVPLAWLTILTVCLLAACAYGAVALGERLTLGPRLISPLSGAGHG